MGRRPHQAGLVSATTAWGYEEGIVNPFWCAVCVFLQKQANAIEKRDNLDTTPAIQSTLRKTWKKLYNTNTGYEPVTIGKWKKSMQGKTY